MTNLSLLQEELILDVPHWLKTKRGRARHFSSLRYSVKLWFSNSKHKKLTSMVKLNWFISVISENASKDKKILNFIWWLLNIWRRLIVVIKLNFHSKSIRTCSRQLSTPFIWNKKLTSIKKRLVSKLNWMICIYQTITSFGILPKVFLISNISNKEMRKRLTDFILVMDCLMIRNFKLQIIKELRNIRRNLGKVLVKTEFVRNGCSVVEYLIMLNFLSKSNLLAIFWKLLIKDNQSMEVLKSTNTSTSITLLIS